MVRRTIVIEYDTKVPDSTVIQLMGGTEHDQLMYEHGIFGTRDLTGTPTKNGGRIVQDVVERA